MPLWTPAEIVTDLWLDASALDSITTDVGVSDWADKNANGLSVAQDIGTQQPVVISAALNGLDVIRFDGIDDFLSGGDILDLGTGSIALFVLGKFSSSSGSQCFITKSIAAGALGRYFLNKTSANYLHGIYSIDSSTNVEAVTPTTYTDTDYHLFCFLVDRTGGTVKLLIDGTLVASDTCPTTSEDLSTTYRFLIGAYNDATDTGIIQPLNGDIAEINVIRSVVSATDQNLIEGYCLWKWGLQVNLPVDHPHKSSAPTIDLPDSLSHIATGGMICGGAAEHTIEQGYYSMVHTGSGGMICGGQAIEFTPDGLGSLSPLSFVDYPYKSINIDRWNDPSFKWTDNLFEPFGTVDWLDGPMTNNNPVDVISWSGVGHLGMTGMEYWRDCLDMFRRWR